VKGKTPVRRVSMNWLNVLIGAVIGFVVGWFVMGVIREIKYLGKVIESGKAIDEKPEV